MIFHWIWLAVKWVLRLVIPPPAPQKRMEIDGKMPCEACGFQGGLKVEYQVVTTKPGKADAIRKGLMKLTCPRCGAFFRLAPLFAGRGGGRQVGPDEVGGNEVRGLTA